MKSYISIDIGGTKAAIARFSINPEIPGFSIEEQKMLRMSGYSEAGSFFSDVSGAIQKLWKEDVSGIGIGAGGLIDSERGMILDWTLCRFLQGYPIKDYLSKRFSVNVSVMNDAECFAMGEWAFGAGENAGIMFGATLGTGLGGCLLLDGKPFKGAHGYAGEIGEIGVSGRLLEAHSSGTALKELSGMVGEKLHGLACKGDKAAIGAFKEYGIRVGAVVRCIMAAYDPQIIVLGGSVSKSFGFFSESMMAHLRKSFEEPVYRSIRVVPSEMENAALPGAVVPLLRGNTLKT